MNAYLTSLLAKAPAVHHCAGKLDGCIVAMIEATPGHTLGTHQVVVINGGKLIETPIAAEDKVRTVFHRMVRELNAASV